MRQRVRRRACALRRLARGVAAGEQCALPQLRPQWPQPLIHPQSLRMLLLREARPCQVSGAYQCVSCHPCPMYAETRPRGGAPGWSPRQTRLCPDHLAGPALGAVQATGGLASQSGGEKARAQGSARDQRGLSLLADQVACRSHRGARACSQRGLRQRRRARGPTSSCDKFLGVVSTQHQSTREA